MNKPVLLFIHGGGKGAYKEDKILASSFEKRLKDRMKVIYPGMPDENNPDYTNYSVKIDEELKSIKGTVLLAGHSVGACFLLKFLSEEKPAADIAGLFLLATPYWGEGGWQYEGFRLKNNFAQSLAPEMPLYFYHCKDDTVVPCSHLDLYKREIPHAQFREIDTGGHQFNNDLSEVVKDILNLYF